MNNSVLRANFGSFSDIELAKSIKSGNLFAFDELVRRYSKTVAFLSRKYTAATLTAEDWFQEGMLGLIKATSSFRAENGTSFATFAAVCVRNHLNSVYRKVHNSKNSSFLNTSEFTESDIPPVCSPEDDYISQEQYSLLTSGLTKQLSKTEWDVFCCHLAGLTSKQIAAKLNLSIKSADNALYRAKAKIKKSLKPN